MQRILFCVALLLSLHQPVGAAEAGFPEPTTELCSVYRQGPVVHRRMPVYYGAPSEDPASFYWIDVWFRPEYLFDPGTADLPRPDGLPNRDLLFDINIADGQPLPLAYRRSAKPQEDDFYTLLLMGGLQHKPIESWLAILANWSFHETERFLAGEIPDFTGTGENYAGLELIEVPSLRYLDWDTRRLSIFAELDSENEIRTVMSCGVEGTIPVPHCSIHEKSKHFEMDYGGFRRNQLDQLETIRRHARNFTACLTWEGD